MLVWLMSNDLWSIWKEAFCPATLLEGLRTGTEDLRVACLHAETWTYELPNISSSAHHSTETGKLARFLSPGRYPVEGLLGSKLQVAGDSGLVFRNRSAHFECVWYRYTVSSLQPLPEHFICQFVLLTLILLTWRIVWARNNARK